MAMSVALLRPWSLLRMIWGIAWRSAAWSSLLLGLAFGARGATEIGLEVGLGFAVGPQPPVLVALIFAFLAGTASGVSIGSVVGVLGGVVCGVVEAILQRRAGFPGWERLRPYAPCWPSIAPIGLIISDAAYFFDTYGNPDWGLLCLALVLLLLCCSVALVKTPGSAAASVPLGSLASSVLIGGAVFSGVVLGVGRAVWFAQTYRHLGH